jgi:hypothetical protein
VNFALSKELSRLAAIASLAALAAFGGARSAAAANGAEAAGLVLERPELLRAWGASERPRFGFQSPPLGEAPAASAIAFVAVRLSETTRVAPAAHDASRLGAIGEARGQFTPSDSASPVVGASWRRLGAALAAFAAAIVLVGAIGRFRNRRARQEHAVLNAVSIAGQRAQAEEPDVAFHSQIEAAAETSVWCGRSTGIVYFEIQADGAAAPAERQAKSKRSAANVASQLRRALGPVDFVRVLNGGEIVVCLPLLFGAAELRERAERLRDAIEELKLAGAPGLAKAGTAMYPLDGYDGASLIAAAGAKCRAAQGKPQSSSPYVLVEPATRIRLMGEAYDAPARGGVPSRLGPARRSLARTGFTLIDFTKA